MGEHLVSDGYKLDERDAMAWQAMMVIISNSDWMTWRKEAIASEAYEIADAFLAERKRQQGEA